MLFLIPQPRGRTIARCIDARGQLETPERRAINPAELAPAASAITMAKCLRIQYIIGLCIIEQGLSDAVTIRLINEP